RGCLERCDAVSQAGGGLEAEGGRGAPQLFLPLGQRVLERLPLDPLQRPRRELSRAAAGQRPELTGLRGAHDRVAAATEIDVSVGPCRATVRRRPELPDQAKLLERRFDLGAERAPLD